MRILTFDLDGQYITQKIPQKVIADSENYIKLQFRPISQEWDGGVKNALLRFEGKTYTKLLDKENCCIFDKNLLGKSGSLSVAASLVRTLEDGTILKLYTNAVRVSVGESGKLEGNDAPYAPDLLEQVMQYLEEVAHGGYTKQEIEQLFVQKKEKGVASGVAELDANAKIFKRQIPDDITNHIGNKNNPHEVTAEQIEAIPMVNGTQGQLLGFTGTNTIGAMQAPDIAGGINTHNQNQQAHPYLKNLIDGKENAGQAAKVMQSLTAHINSKQNPHGVTASQVGAIPRVNGTQGQLLGFIDNNIVGAVNAPSGGDGGGKRNSRFVIGTSTAGWTKSDCDYLCDGKADQEEINAAVQALPANGGEIIILDGVYNIEKAVLFNKNNIKIRGNGGATVLKRQASARAMLKISALNFMISDMSIDGNILKFDSGEVISFDIPFQQPQNSIVKNIIFSDCANCILSIYGKNILIENNFFYDNKIAVGNLNSDVVCVSNNIFFNNDIAVDFATSDKVNVIGNIFDKTSAYTETQFTIRGRTLTNSVIVGNVIKGKPVAISGNSVNNIISNNVE